MRLTRMECHACQKGPGLMAWIHGEVNGHGYPEWCHPKIAFARAGYDMRPENRDQMDRIYLRLFGRSLPDDGGFLCPSCQDLMAEEIPRLWQSESTEGEPSSPPHVAW